MLGSIICGSGSTNGIHPFNEADIVTSVQSRKHEVEGVQIQLLTSIQDDLSLLNAGSHSVAAQQITIAERLQFEDGMPIPNLRRTMMKPSG
jgi:hypothetical protein